MSEVSISLTDNTELSIEVDSNSNDLNSPLSNSRSRAKLEKAKMLDEEVQVAEKTAVVRRESRIVAEQVVGGVFSQMIVGALSSDLSERKDNDDEIKKNSEERKTIVDSHNNTMDIDDVQNDANDNNSKNNISSSRTKLTATPPTGERKPGHSVGMREGRYYKEDTDGEKAN